MRARFGAVALPLAVVAAVVVAGCGGGGGGSAEPPPPPVEPQPLIDTQLRQLIEALELTGDPSTGRNLPSIDDPLPRLGRKLFFSKSLSGDFDTACASCHHPMLGGSNGLSLPVGPGAEVPDLVGPGRAHPDGHTMGRNAPTTFNIGMYDSGLFYDSRIESIGKVAGANGAGTGIRTPDTPFNVEDPGAGATLSAAQPRFPVTEPTEMKGYAFEAGSDAATIRDHVAARLGNYGPGAGEIGPNGWLDEFQSAFASDLPAEELITFDNIALAIGEYLRSQVFVDTPWRAYVQGDDAAIGTSAKRGAQLFLRQPPSGFGCVRCHTGDLFTDELHHTIAFPQVGPGKGDGNRDDFGRERVTGEQFDRYRFRTPGLLNVEATAPFTHSGAFATLQTVVAHYMEPDDAVAAFFDAGGLCSAEQFDGDPDCESRFPKDVAVANTEAALDRLRIEQGDDPDGAMPDIGGVFSEAQASDLVAFLRALTDPCIRDRACLAPWIAEDGDDPDGNQLNAVDGEGRPL